ncbi:MAG TPA: S1 RNA-binding domain-containing protein, partial [Desulfobacteraceae bacterium]|nr:S1 RNA-binding domain-containing protein [Desulfobacteraceae bacterium]
DLRKGMQLPGIVTHITAFDAFVDISVHQDGLVHISQMADRFVKNPADIVKVQQKVTVTVLEIDMGRNRISLSMKKSVDPMEKSTRKKSETPKQKHRPSRPKPDKYRKPEKKPIIQGSLAEALLKSGLK